MRPTTTRLAPSPTGALHLGNARTFLLNHLLAKQEGWRMLMRVEDLDGPRVKPHAIEQALEDLQWLGLEWEEPVCYQSNRTGAYHDALKHLIDAGHAYPCTCSRKDIEAAASAPHRGDNTGAYPGTCRGRFTSPEQAAAQTDRPVAWRVHVPDEPIMVQDRFCGDTAFDLRQVGGDFVVFKNDGTAAYQLAVVVDDADAGVDAIVRGDDLLDSAARQIHLRRLLETGPEPVYYHLPLVAGMDGRRLAKRHGDTRLATYRQQGVRPERILGLLGAMAGLLPDGPREATLVELLERFDLTKLPPADTPLTPEHEAFLQTG